MKRFRFAALAAVVSVCLGVAVPAAMASNRSSDRGGAAASAPALYTVHVAGVGQGRKQFKGTYAIQRFVVVRHAAYAVGTLTGTLRGHRVTRNNVMLPAALTGSSSNAARAAAQASCAILHLVLGPIHLNLLGLNVNTNRIVVNITAIPGAGNLLGNLLCDLTNALNQGGALTQLNHNLQQLTATLTGLTSLLGGL